MIKNINKINYINKTSKVNKALNKRNLANKIVFSLLFFSLVCGCSSYKSSWDCPKAKGIGCSSLEYADEMAREQILLNTGKYKKLKQVSQNKRTNNSQLKENKVLINQDLLGGKEYELIEIE
jgi:hypothetical protein